MNKFQIISSNSPLLSIQCVKLSDELFGLNYHNFNFFNNQSKIKLLAINKNKVVGFLIAEKIKSNQIEIQSIGIENDWQNKLVGTALMKKLVEKFTKKNTNIITKAWKYKNVIYVKKLIEKFGLKPLINKGKIWKEKCNILFKCKYYKKQCKCECIVFSN